MSFFSEAFAWARRRGDAQWTFGWYLCAIATGLLIPCLVVIVGMIARLLEQRGITQSPVRLGSHLAVPVPASWLEQPPLVQLTHLVVIALLLALGFALATWGHRRGSERRSRSVVEALHRELLRQSLRRAEIEGAISQRERAKNLIEERLPQLARGLVAWWQAVPRSLLLLAGSVTVASLVDVPLAALAIISGLLLWQFYRFLKSRAEEETSVWELPRSRRRLVDLISQAPLLAKTHTGGAADQAFQAELDLLMQQIASGQDSRNRLVPLMTVAISFVIALLVLGLGVNLLAAPSHLSVTSSLVLGLALAGAVAGSTRLVQAISLASVADEAARAVARFLQTGDDAAPSELRVGMVAIRDSIVVQDVELGVEGAGPILSGVSLEFRPREIVALMGTRPVSALALAELILGIGRPNRGQILFDGIDLKDLHPRALAKLVLWVGADGPIGEGTLLENMVGEGETTDPREVIAVAESLGLDGLLSRLEDGLQTSLSAGDRRLSNEEKYMIGIARAVLHRPQVIVVQEPALPADELAGDQAIEALRKLADQSSLVLVLPRRLTTLRTADRVVLLNGPKLAGEGKHNGLLQSSDLYRHLNYLLFNPYRNAT